MRVKSNLNAGDISNAKGLPQNISDVSIHTVGTPYMASAGGMYAAPTGESQRPNTL